MGCQQSSRHRIVATTAGGEFASASKGRDITLQQREWKLLLNAKESRQRYEKEGSLPQDSQPGHVELRALLDDDVGKDRILAFAESKRKAGLLRCWFDIQAIRVAPAGSDLFSSGQEVYLAYIKLGGLAIPELQAVLSSYPVAVEDCRRFFEHDDEDNDALVTSAEVVPITTAAAAAASVPSGTSASVSVSTAGTMLHLSWLQWACFLAMYNGIFLPFKVTVGYREMNESLRGRYNHMNLLDFEAICAPANGLVSGGRRVALQGSNSASKVSQYNIPRIQECKGAFGVIVPCRRKHTGKRCAMKIQRKRTLLEHFESEPWRIDYEKKVYAACSHPFLCEFMCSFHTPTLAVIVTSLCTIGDLHTILQAQPGRRLPHMHVRFYTAEVVSALAYMHDMGLIYRDLRPASILLHEDGHVRLGDLGAVIDVEGDTLGQYDETEHMAPVFSKLSASARSEVSKGGTGTAEHTLSSHSHPYPQQHQQQREPQNIRMQTSVDSTSLNSQHVPALVSIAQHSSSRSRQGLSQSYHTNSQHHAGGGSGSGSGRGGGAADMTGVVGESAASESSHALDRIAADVAPATGANTNLSSVPCKSSHPRRVANGGRARAKSITGALGYMAPEILAMLGQPSCLHSGYTNAADWWSLGATVHKLYTGHRPYHPTKQTSVVADFNSSGRYSAGAISRAADTIESVKGTGVNAVQRTVGGSSAGSNSIVAQIAHTVKKLGGTGCEIGWSSQMGHFDRGPDKRQGSASLLEHDNADGFDSDADSEGGAGGHCMVLHGAKILYFEDSGDLRVRGEGGELDPFEHEVGKCARYAFSGFAKLKPAPKSLDNGNSGRSKNLFGMLFGINNSSKVSSKKSNPASFSFTTAENSASNLSLLEPGSGARAEGDSFGINADVTPLEKCAYELARAKNASDFTSSSDVNGTPASRSSIAELVYSAVKSQSSDETETKESVACAAADFVTHLLHFSPDDRLGGGRDAAAEVMFHAYFGFNEANWASLDAKQLPVPPLPFTAATSVPFEPSKSTSTNSGLDAAISMEHLISQLGFDSWMSDDVSSSEDANFSSWDYVSVNAVYDEISAVKEAEKVRFRE